MLASAIRARWPRCTPSKLPIATTAPLRPGGTSSKWRKIRTSIFSAAGSAGRQHMRLRFQHQLVVHLADAVHDHGPAIDLAYRGGGHHRVTDPDRQLEHDAGGEKDRTAARQLGAQEGRDEADRKRAM